MVVQCLVFGVLCYVLNRFPLGNHEDSSWPAATEDIAGYALGFGIAMRFFAAWRRRQALPSLAETDDDAPGAPDPAPQPSSTAADVAEDWVASAYGRPMTDLLSFNCLKPMVSYTALPMCQGLLAAIRVSSYGLWLNSPRPWARGSAIGA